MHGVVQEQHGPAPDRAVAILGGLNEQLPLFEQRTGEHRRADPLFLQLGLAAHQALVHQSFTVHDHTIGRDETALADDHHVAGPQGGGVHLLLNGALAQIGLDRMFGQGIGQTLLGAFLGPAFEKFTQPEQEGDCGQ